MGLPAPSRLLALAALAAWLCVWTLKPTPAWKIWWHGAEDWAGRWLLRDVGLYVLVFSFPPLTAAAMAYLHLHLLGRRPGWMPAMSNPVFVLNPLGMVSAFELLMAAMFATLLAWTFFCGIARDFKKSTAEKFLRLHLSSLQVKVMQVGTRMGSLAEICLAVLLFPILRKMAVLKLVGVQFESAVRYHVWIGNLLTLLAAAHGAAIMSVWASKGTLLSEMTKWPRTGRVNPAGGAALATGLVIWVTSLPPVRRKNFHLFYSAHHLHAAFLVFFLLHGGDRHFYTVSSGALLFALDKLARVIGSRPAASMVSAKILPWHPFSITSSSAMGGDRVSFVIKCNGRWTGSLYSKIKSIQNSDPAALRSFAVAVEGPYGPPSLPYERYDALILVAGGSGITPFLSVLREISAGRAGSPARVGLVYCVRRAEELAILGSVSHLLLKKKKNGFPGLVRVKIFVTREGNSSGVSARELIEAASQQTSTIVSGEESAPTTTAQSPSSLGFRSTAAVTGFASVVFLAALVGLSHGFLPPPGSPNGSSLATDLVVLAAFAIAAGCGGALAIALVRRTSPQKDVPALCRSHGDTDRESQSENERAPDGEPEISFGNRPDLQAAVEDLRGTLGAFNLGVFVCGPDSMQEAVAEFCRTHRSSGEGREAWKHILDFHSIKFSL
ncbi:unnamed protein product [Spirodela intermedia]|uniref:FAD-binding FR-type domain-containing protein n=1 Tax=Spirodela intermedia TaxID=51605 RepID=A0A7I8JCV9_SPIIN|nr:unnamed protein product [Spirodela intermedia]CAA6667994.1 unnamed protein product [Spirodela intermedia]